MKYGKLVEELRETATFTKFNDLLSKREQKLENLAFDAADAIEELEEEVEKAAKRNAELHAELEKWVSAAEKAGEPKRGEWVMMRRANSGHYKGCSVCHAPMPTDTMLDYLDDADCKWCYSCGAKMGGTE